MPIQFPTNPEVNQEYTYEGKVWQWDGSAWVGVRQETGIQRSNIWSKQNLLIPKRGFGLNSGYNGATDQRRTQAGTINSAKHYMERDLGQFLFVIEGSWTPEAITTELWLDGADASTITLNGSVVSQWNDKSGNGRNATQSDNSKRPEYIANSINGRYALDWDGVDDSMEVSGAISTSLQSVMSGDDTHSVAMVLEADVISNSPVIFHVPESSWEFLIEINASGGGLYWGYTTSAYRTYSTGDFVSITKPTFFVLTKSGSSTGDAYSAGSLVSSYSVNFGATPTMTSNFLIGSYSSASYNYNGRIAEIIVSNETWDTETRQRVEGYLAHKWGLEGDLPVDHPYKSVVP
jgi:hypothetical protein